MTPKKLHWIQFFPADWRAEPCLKLCSLAAKGLWIEMLCLMTQSSVHGHLCHTNKPEPLQPKDLAKILGNSEEEILPLLAELETNGVFSRDDDIKTIYSRRLLKDEAKRQNKALKSQRYRQRQGIRALSSDSYSNVTNELPVCGRRDQRPKTKDYKPEAGDQRLEAEDQRLEAYQPIGQIHIAAGQSPLLSNSTSDADLTKTAKTINWGRALKVKANGCLTAKSVCDLPTFIDKGTEAGLEEDFCREEYKRLSQNGWCDSHGKPICDIFAYVRSTARNQSREMPF
jgi:hypothetical protein